MRTFVIILPLALALAACGDQAPQTANADASSAAAALTPHRAVNNSCNLLGGGRAPAWLQVYDEINTGRGNKLWEGYIARDQRVPITTSSGRLRYDYRIEANEAWRGDVGMWCRNGDDQRVP